MEEKILELRSEGKTYSEITKIVGCSKGTVSYYCGDGQKEKSSKRCKLYRSDKPLARNVDNFQRKSRIIAFDKVRAFGRRSKGDSKGLKREPDKNFTYKELLNKVGENPRCYLTNDPIDFTEAKSYSLDHIMPVSRGGTNKLSNAGLCTKVANMSKANMTLEEYLSHCQKVLKNFGYEVIKPK